jgi:hypothetical protein
MLATAVLALSLVVRVYDNAGVLPADRAAALSVAEAILKDAGIDVAWRDGAGCDEGAARDAALPNGSAPAPEVIIRIVMAPLQMLPGSLGFSLIDLTLRSGTLATVFADRVADLARLGGVDPGRLLGRAMAHEVGHLLLGTTRHANAGIMRGTWTTGELQREQPRDWLLLSDDIAGMRRGLVARAHRADKPAAVLAQQETGTSNANGERWAVTVRPEPWALTPEP